MLFNSKVSFLLSAFFLSSVLFNTSFPQQTSYLDSLDGKFALQFQITQNFSISNFQGSVFSGKYHFSKRDAIRFGLSLNLSSTDTEAEINYLDTTFVDNANQDENVFDITISSQYIRYLGVTESISFYGGIGPLFNIYKVTRERFVESLGIDGKYESETNVFSIGFDLIAGVEWWFNKFMSLSGEYGLRFAYRSLETTIKDEKRDSKSNTNSYYLTGNQVKFGIAVYF